MRISILWMKNNTSTVVVGKAEERTVTMVVLVWKIRSSEYRRNPVCVYNMLSTNQVVFEGWRDCLPPFACPTLGGKGPVMLH